MLKRSVILTLIVFIAVFLRFWQLSEIPVSLSHDEAAIGYNAWSILQTGKDEYGVKLPVLFRSFDDYKLPGYIYTTAISERIFGLNEFAVRFPSAFFGVLSVVMVYLLVKTLFEKPFFFDYRSINPVTIALFISFMLAISPWHINFSRAAFETNGSLFFLILGLFLIIKSVKNPLFFVFGIFSFVVSIYFYYTARIVVPIILIVFISIYRKELFRVKKYVLLSFIAGFILLLPIFSHMFTAGLSRINQVSIFEDKSLTNPYSEAILRNNNSIASKIFYNRRLAYFQEFFDNYLKNFAPDFYFTNGTGPMGLLYIWEIPFFAYGIFLTFKIKSRWKWLILSWFLTIPLVGGLTTGQPNALRTLPNVIPAAFFSGFGLYEVFKMFKNKNYLRIYSLVFLFVILLFLLRFFSLYFDYNKNLTALSWGDGHKQMARFIGENKKNYDTIYITGDYWRPYVYLLFYIAYPPSYYQAYGSRYKFDNMYFGQAAWDKGEGISLASDDLSSLTKGRTLFILSYSDFLSQTNLIENRKHSYKIIILKKIDGTIAKEPFYGVKLR